MSKKDKKSVLGEDPLVRLKSPVSEKDEAGAKHNGPEVPHNETLKQNIIQLAQDFTIIGISEVYNVLTAHLEENHDIVIDASNVQSVDTAGLQLLLAFSLELNKRGCDLELRNPSDEFLEMCHLLDLSESFALDESVS